MGGWVGWFGAPNDYCKEESKKVESESEKLEKESESKECKQLELLCGLL